MEQLRSINKPIYDAIDTLLPPHESSEQLKRALYLFYGLLELIDSVETTNSIPVSVKWNIYENLFLYLNAQDFEDGEQVPVIQKLSQLYDQVDYHYKRIIEECFTHMMSGLLRHLGKERCVDWQDLMAYCHYEAGLPGLGILRLLCEAGLEDRHLATTRKHEMNALGTFLQLVENTAIPKEASMLPDDADMDRLDRAMSKMSKQANLLAVRIKSPLGRRLILEPYLLALNRFNMRHSDGVMWESWIIAVLVVLMAVLLYRFIDYCCVKRESETSFRRVWTGLSDWRLW